MPDVDVSLRGAASIARRLQDPLAELVKIDPKSIGVGQYQHDVNQSELARTLDAVVEDCVNAVGVDLNTAQRAAAGARVGPVGHGGQGGGALARGQWRFRSRKQLLEVAGLGAKTFEQSRGLLAHSRWRQPAGHDRRAPRNLPGGASASCKPRASPMAELMGRSDSAARRSTPSSLPTSALVPSRSRTFWGSWKSPAATRARTLRSPASTTAWKTSRI